MCCAQEQVDPELAQLLHESGDYAATAAAYELLIAENPSSPRLAEFYRGLADCYWHHPVQDLDKSFAVLDKAIELASDSDQRVQYRLDRAKAYCELGQLDKVLAEFQQLIQDYPSSQRLAEFYRGLAYCYWRDPTKDMDKFFAALDKAIELASNSDQNVQYREDRANAYRDLDEFDKTLAEFQQLIKDYPSSPRLAEFYRGLADCYWHDPTKDMDKSFAALNKAIELASDSDQNVQYRLDRANAYREMGQYDKTLAEFQQLIKYYPTSSRLAEFYRGVADCYLHDPNKDRDKSFAALNKAIELARDLDQESDQKLRYRVDRANAYREMGQYDKTLAEFQQLIKDYPTSSRLVEFYRGVADCYLHDPIIDREKSSAALDKAMELASDSDPKMQCRLDQANAYREMRQYDKMLAEFQQLIKDYPTSSRLAEFYRGVADCY
ncbi:MAG: tetratricopeptide repeat protein, partial [Armatimonadetes bacterium]|nr:tetratricopeptide repeat protein [Armatimonadota bacterium]